MVTAFKKEKTKEGSIAIGIMMISSQTRVFIFRNSSDLLKAGIYENALGLSIL